MNNYRINKDFQRLFLKKEQRELYGAGYKNFIYLGIILLITFLVLGFANGSLEYLQKKMDDPFIRWMGIEVPHVYLDNVHEIMEDLNRNVLKDSFNIAEMGGYTQYTLFFLKEDSVHQFQAMGRTVTHDNKIFSKINEEKNLILGFPSMKEHDIGLIITQELLDELGYKNKPPHINMSFPVTDTEYRPVPVPVIAVVHQLPGRSHFVTTPYFHNKRNYSRYNPFNILDEEYSRELQFFAATDKSKANEIGKDLMEFIGESLEWKEALIDYTVEPYTECYKEGFKIRIIFDEDWSSHTQLDMIMNQVRIGFGVKKNLSRIYTYNLSGHETFKKRYDYVSVYFNTLDKIREFQAYIDENHNLKIDMSQVESKENYNFVSRLTRIISVFLICFSILSIVFFIINILKSHIEKIKQNLGTFKAFGLSNASLIRIYVFITMRFLILSGLVALLLAYALGSIGAVRGFLSLFNTVVEENQTYFDLINWVTFAALASIIIINGVIVRFSLAGVLSRTPGDLIYSRD